MAFWDPRHQRDARHGRSLSPIPFPQVNVFNDVNQDLDVQDVPNGMALAKPPLAPPTGQRRLNHPGIDLVPEMQRLELQRKDDALKALQVRELQRREDALQAMEWERRLDRARRDTRREIEMKHGEEEAKKAEDQKRAKEEKRRIIDDYERDQEDDERERKRDEERMREKIKRQEREAKEKEEREWKEFLRKQKELKEKEEKEKKEAEEKLEEEISQRLLRFGFSSTNAHAIAKAHPEKGDSLQLVTTGSKSAYAKVHSKYLLPKTLDHFQIRFRSHESDSDYLVVLEELDDRTWELLFEHTRLLRSKKRQLKPSKAKPRRLLFPRPFNESRRSKQLMLVRSR